MAVWTEYLHQEVGINSRLDAFQAAVLRIKLPHLDDWSNARFGKAKRYNELLAGADLPFELSTPFIRPDGRHIFHLYVVRAPKHREALMDHLAQRGVGTKVLLSRALAPAGMFSLSGLSGGRLS